MSKQKNDPAQKLLSSADLSPNCLTVIPLGGLGEIGKNTMLLCYGDDMILIDAGLAFPSDDMPGVDLILPNINFLTQNQDKIKGLVITHGHEDHIGGIPFILKELTIPIIYGPALALGLLEGKLKEVGIETKMQKVRPKQSVKIGCFTVHFIRCTHSIADSFSLIIETPIGTLIHTGDFKFDFTPVDGEQFDIHSITQAAEEGILLLMSDSTNVERPGYTPSEKTVWKKLDEVFASARKRIIVTTFASNVHRVRQVLQAAIKYDRKVSILGRSMLNLAGIARELGYMKFPDGLIIPVEETNNLPYDRVVILTTGSQGEPMSALTRIANNDHKQIKIVSGDTVIISATPIPGNERLVSNTINSLFLLGAEVIYGREAGVHVSGHACREEQKLMVNLCRPKFFMPIHGEYRMLVSHAELAAECGVDPNNTFVMKNGDALQLQKDSAKVIGHVESGIILVDSSRAWQIDEAIINDRKHLAENGMIIAAITIDSKKELLAAEINMKGIIFPREIESADLEAALKSEITKSLKSKAITKYSGTELQKHIQEHLINYLGETIKSNPFIQVIVQELALAK